MPNKLRLIFCCLAFASGAFAADKPPEIASTIHASAPYGKGNYRLLMMNIYDASLWTDANPWSWDKPFALSLTYNVDASSKKIVDRSIDEMTESAGINDEQQTQYRALLSKLIPNVKDGDSLTALYLPNTSIQFFHNGKSTGTSTNVAFAKAFLGIWLSEKTTDPDFRQKLLSKGGAE